MSPTASSDRPVRQPGRDHIQVDGPAGPGWRTLAVVFLATLAVYLLSVVRMLPYVEPPTGDQPHYLMQTISLVEDGDLDLRNNYTTAESYSQFSAPGRRREGFRGIPVSYPVQPTGHIVVRAADAGETWYPKHSPGLPVLLVPGWLIGQALTPLLNDLTALGNGGWPGIVVQMSVVGSLLATQIFLLAWDVSGRRAIAFAVWAALSFSVPQMLVSLMIYPEAVAALALVYAFRHLVVRPLPASPWRLQLVGLALAVLPWLNPRFVLVSGVLALLAVVAVWRASRQQTRARSEGSPPLRCSQALLHRHGDSEEHVMLSAAKHLTTVKGCEILRKLRMTWIASHLQVGRIIVQDVDKLVQGGRVFATLGLLLGPLAVSMALLRWYQLGVHGSSMAVADQYEGFFVPTMVDGRLGADWQALLLATAGLFVDRQYGLLVFAPIYALAVVGLVALLRSPSYRWTVVSLGLIAVPYVALTADFRVWWGGWSPPARYLAVLTPLLAAPLARSLLALAGNRPYQVLFASLAGFGVLVAIVLLLQLGDPEVEQAIFSNPSRNPAMLRWLLLRFGLDLTPILPAIAPWFGDRRGPIPWPQIVGYLTLLGVLVGLAIRALPSSEHATSRRARTAPARAQS